MTTRCCRTATAPRFDSASLFARLLDDRAGHFSVRPVGDARVRRRYIHGTLVRTTTFTTAWGTVEFTDALAMGEGVQAHDLGAGSPGALLRPRIRAEQIMFGVRGERDLAERTLEWLDGWRGNRPVRTGNGAWAQRRLNVYGELLGNFPQAFSHVGLINAAWAISQAEDSRPATAPADVEQP